MPICERHAVFRSYVRVGSTAAPGFEIDSFLGTRSRVEFLAGAADLAVPREPDYPPADKEYFEWIDLLESIEAANGRYTMMELGAGYGRWSVRAAAAVRQRRAIPFRLVAIEAEPRHFRWLQQHMRDNGIRPGAYRLFHGIVSDWRGEESFYVARPQASSNEAAEWYGQAISSDPQPRTLSRWSRLAAWLNLRRDPDGASGDRYEGFNVVRATDGYKTIRLPSYRLRDIMPRTRRVDLIDMDIQGAEWKVVSSSIDALDRRVARLHIATHDHDIEESLRELLKRRGWECRADYPCTGVSDTPWGPISFVDGVQSWMNPRLA
jgi:FkbM family methyltransferase